MVLERLDMLSQCGATVAPGVTALLLPVLELCCLARLLRTVLAGPELGGIVFCVRMSSWVPGALDDEAVCVLEAARRPD